MKIKLSVSLNRQKRGMGLFLEKETELDFLPDVGEEVRDNGDPFTVESRTFYLEGYVSLHLEQGFNIITDLDEEQIKNSMKKAGWQYRGDSNIDCLEL